MKMNFISGFCLRPPKIHMYRLGNLVVLILIYLKIFSAVRDQTDFIDSKNTKLSRLDYTDSYVT